MVHYRGSSRLWWRIAAPNSLRSFCPKSPQPVQIIDIQVDCPLTMYCNVAIYCWMSIRISP